MAKVHLWVNRSTAAFRAAIFDAPMGLRAGHLAWHSPMHLWVDTSTAAFSVATADALVGNLVGFNVAKVDAPMGQYIKRCI